MKLGKIANAKASGGKMKKLLVLVCLALGACMDEGSLPLPPPQQTRPALPDDADYSAREDCLYATICRMIRERGDSPIILDDIAVSATGICSQTLHIKWVGHYGPEFGEELFRYDQLDKKRHAFAVALEQAKVCGKAPKP